MSEKHLFICILYGMGVFCLNKQNKTKVGTASDLTKFNMKTFEIFLFPAAWPSDSSDVGGSKKQESLGVQNSPPS